MKPHVTITYGVTYDLSMPPYEVNGKQVEMVDAAGNPIGIKSYLTKKQNAALAGRLIQPQIGFDLIGNAAGGANKYPYSAVLWRIQPARFHRLESDTSTMAWARRSSGATIP